MKGNDITAGRGGLAGFASIASFYQGASNNIAQAEQSLHNAANAFFDFHKRKREARMQDEELALKKARNEADIRHLNTQSDDVEATRASRIAANKANANNANANAQNTKLNTLTEAQAFEAMYAGTGDKNAEQYINEVRKVAGNAKYDKNGRQINGKEAIANFQNSQSNQQTTQVASNNNQTPQKQGRITAFTQNLTNAIASNSASNQQGKRVLPMEK